MQHRTVINLQADGTTIASQEIVRVGSLEVKFDQVVPANTTDHLFAASVPLAELESLLISASAVSGAPVDAIVRTNAPSGGIPFSDGSIPGSAGGVGEGDEFEFASAGFVTWQSGTGQPCPLTEDVTAVYISTGDDPVRIRFITLLSSGVDE